MCATIITEDFNDIPDGNLDSDANWTGDAGIDVSTTLPYEGAKGVEKTGDTEEYIDTVGGTQCNDGKITFYWRRSSNSTGESYFFLTEGGATRVYLDMRSDGKFRTYAGGYIELMDFVADTWYETIVEWRSADHLIKITVNDVVKRDWAAPHTAWTNFIDGIHFGGKDLDVTYFFVDTIAEEPYSAPAEADVGIIFGCNM